MYKFLLNLHSTSNRIDHAGKFSQHVISWSINYSSMALLDEVRHHFFIGIKGADSRLFILAHETTVTLYIRTQDGSQFAFNFLGGHGLLPFKRLEAEGQKQLIYKL